MHPELANYAADGNVYGLQMSGGRKEWMPTMGERTPRPVFVTLGKQRDFETITYANHPSWYDRWAEAALGRQILMGKGLAVELFLKAAEALVKDGVLIRTEHHQGATLAINPDALVLSTDVLFLITPRGKRRLSVDKADAEALVGMPCLDATEEFYEETLVNIKTLNYNELFLLFPFAIVIIYNFNKLISLKNPKLGVKLYENHILVLAKKCHS